MFSTIRRLVLFALAVSLLGLTSPLSGPASASTSVSGTVFQDYNSNGRLDSAVTPGQATDGGVAGIGVRAYDSTGALVGTATSGADGSYTLSIAGNATDDLRIEFSIPTTNPLSSFVSSFAGPNSGTSVQFVKTGATNANYAINVPGEYCQNNPNISVSRLCSGASASVNASASAWVTRYDGGPYTTAHGWTDVYNSWPLTTSATKSETGSILGMTWDSSTKRIFHSAYVRRHAELFEVNGTPVPGALFVTTPTGTTAESGTGGTTSFLVDLETLLSGDQFSNSTPGQPGYIPTNAARKIQYMMDSTVDGGVENDGVDSDLVTGQDGVYEEVGKTGIGDIESDGNGTLWVVSLYDKKLYQVTVPSTGVPTAMTSLGDITAGVPCSNGNARPFSIKLWRGSLYLGVVCDGADDFNPSSPQTITNTNVSFVIRKLDLATSIWSTFFGPHPLNSTGNIIKGRADTAWSIATYNTWNPWSDTYNHCATTGANCTGDGYYWTRPQPMLSEIEFDRDGSMILSFRDRSGDQSGTSDAEAPDGGRTSFPTLASGDIYRVCRTGAGYDISDYVFEGGGGCPQSTNANHGTEYYFGDYWFNLTSRGHGEIGVGLSELVPGFPDLRVNAYDPKDGDSTGKTFFSGGVRSLLNSTGGPASSPNSGSGIIFFAWAGQAGNPNVSGGFEKTNGMSDIEALCDQAPLQIGNRVWIDTDKDGIQDPGETPVAGATVRLYAADGTTLLGTALTNSSGEYFFASNISEATGGTGDNAGGGIAPGSAYIIRMDNPADYASGGPLEGYVLTKTTATDPITGLDTSVDNNAAMVRSFPELTTAVLQAGVNDHTYDIGFNKPSVSSSSSSTLPVGMGNYVWIDADKDGRQDASEQPIEGVIVTLFNPDGTPAKTIDGANATATTDAKGYYFIDNLAAGSYYAKFTLPAAYRFTTKSSQGSMSANDSNPDATTGITPVFTIGASVVGDTIVDTDSKTKAVFVNPTIDAGVVPIGTVSVGNFVWRDRNGDGVQGKFDSGVTSAILRLKNNDGTSVTDAFGRIVRPQKTKADGKYLFKNLLPGSYVVEITYPREWYPTTKNRPGRARNSSAHRAVSRVLRAGQSDLTLDFGTVRRSQRLLPGTR